MSFGCILKKPRTKSSLRTVRPSNFTSPTRYWSPSVTGISTFMYFVGFFLPGLSS